jgi:hypothetical protein
MRLAQFILANLDPLLDDWDEFARTFPQASDLSRKEVRDHAGRLLRDIAADLRTDQTESEQIAKSRGESEPAIVEVAATAHADERHQQGFDLCQMVAEYRALRATVTRQWTHSLASVGPDDLQDLIRFNEVVDEAQTRSIERFMQDLDGSRELFLGMLGHDLRTPLSAIANSGIYLRRADGLTPEQQRAAAIVSASAARIGKLANNLLEMARLRLGGRLPLARTAVDLHALCRSVIAEGQASRPGHDVVLRAEGETRGTWDEVRVSQLVSNLLENALKYAAPSTPVTVTVDATDDDARISVQNFGPAIPADRFQWIFRPFNRAVAADGTPFHADSFGIGLYVAWEIAHEHGGDIRVTSTAAEGTTFEVRLPRVAAPK